jgi:hypothetical protein
MDTVDAKWVLIIDYLNVPNAAILTVALAG